MKLRHKLMIGGAGLMGLAPSALATSAIDNDTLEGLPQVGTDVGDFLKNLAPGVGAFIIIMGVFGGVGAIVFALVSVVKNKIHV